MYLEVKQWSESQKVMDYPDWFFIEDGDGDILGNSAYAKVINLDLIISEAVIAERKRIIEGLKDIRGT